MCRFAAYIGPPIPLERIVVSPDHSLVQQSQHANQAKLAVNGDGFGLAWYAQTGALGLYRDATPAWSDGNLPDICRMIQAPLFLAHVRASTSGASARENCHPFRYGRWSFMHNGKIGGYRSIRRQLEHKLPDHLYDHRQGATDSELLFLLLLASGLDSDACTAIGRTLRDLESLQSHIADPNRITCALSDGAFIYAFRASSDGRSPTLYHGTDMDSGGAVLASEPLETSGRRWAAVPDQTLVTLGHGSAQYQPLKTARAA